MTTLSNNTDTTTSITLENNMNTTTIETAQIVDNRTLNTLTVRIAAGIVKQEWATPRQAIACANAFCDNLGRLLTTGNNWEMKLQATYEEIVVDGAVQEDFDMIDCLVKLKYISLITGQPTAGLNTIKTIEEARTSYAPYKAEDGVVERVRGYAKIKVSPLFKEAIHALESSEFMRSEVMYKLAYQVSELLPVDLIKAQDYVINGTGEMEEGQAYVSEFFGDDRGRIYQACCYGVNGQSSDMARALMDLHNVPMDYNVADAKKLVLEEMEDMGSWNGDEFKADYLAAVNNPTQFILANLQQSQNAKDGKGPKPRVSKYWNFVKCALIIQAIGKFEKGVGEKPYIGIAVGLDAKCSGPQLAGLMVADEAILRACGFTDTQIDDMYQMTVKQCDKAGLSGLSRNTVKKAFMAVFYGASMRAMMNAETINQDTWEILYSGTTTESEVEEIAKLFYDSICSAFGHKLNNFRNKVKAAGYDYESKTCKYNSEVAYNMPDGLQVHMKLRKEINMDGCMVTPADAPIDCKVEMNMETKIYRNMKFKTNLVDFASYGRTGFVNFIQATDALLARLIVVHAKRLGAQHIVAIHDCFRVNITEMAILEQAIINAYKDMFGGVTNQATADLPLGTDMIGLYFEGSKKATHPDYLETAPKGSQFYGKSKVRRLDEVDGSSINNLIDQLGFTYYFAK